MSAFYVRFSDHAVGASFKMVYERELHYESWVILRAGRECLSVFLATDVTVCVMKMSDDFTTTLTCFVVGRVVGALHRRAGGGRRRRRGRGCLVVRHAARKPAAESNNGPMRSAQGARAQSDHKMHRDAQMAECVRKSQIGAVVFLFFCTAHGSKRCLLLWFVCQIICGRRRLDDICMEVSR